MPLIEIEHHDAVAVLHLDDPTRRNALTLEMCDEITAACDALESDDTTGALVVTGRGKGFCAGADLSQLGDSRRDGLRRIYQGFLRIAESPLPTVAAVNGAAVGAGMNMALATDVRVASTDAYFDTRFLDLGIHPGGGHTWMLQRAVGRAAAEAMVVFGERVDGHTAARIGLCWDCVEPDRLLERAIGMAARAASMPPELVGDVRATFDDTARIDAHSDAVERELDPQVASMDRPAFAERLAALQARIGSRSDRS